MQKFQDVLNRIGARNILDVGSGKEWVGARNTLHEMFSLGGISVRQLVGVGLEDLELLHAKYSLIDFVQGDGCRLPFADKTFDIAYSNAVIEHVSPLPARRSLVSEMLRVARGVFLTTPNRWFPIEVHSRLPIVHWLPASVHNQVLTWLGMEFFSRGIYFDPMSVDDVRACFPETILPKIELGVLGATIIAYCVEQ